MGTRHGSRVLQILYRALFVMVPFYFGAAIVSFDPNATPSDSFVNLPWGFIYGLAWYLAGQALGFNHTFSVLIGLFVWPAFIVSAQVWLSGKVWRAGQMILIACTSLLLISFCIYLPYRSVMPPPLRPFFSVILAASY